MNQEKKKSEELHWLVRPSTIKKLWKGGLTLLVVLVFAGFVITPHPHFSIDGTFGFYAWYGFLSCAFMVIGAKAFGILVKRDQDYYEDKEKTGDNNA